MSHFAELGHNCTFQAPVILGLQYRPGCQKVRVGNDAVIRAFTTIYADVTLGDNVKTGHHVLIREYTYIGDNIVVGTGTIIDGQTTIGSFVKLEGRVYLPTHMTIGNYVFVGPGVVFTNDKYPLRQRAAYEPRGAIVEDHVSIGGNATILPGVRLGEGCMVAAAAVVTTDVPAWHLAVGAPARFEPLPDSLREANQAERW